MSSFRGCSIGAYALELSVTASEFWYLGSELIVLLGFGVQGFGLGHKNSVTYLGNSCSGTYQRLQVQTRD